MNVDLSSANLVSGQRPWTFKFGALQKKRFVINGDSSIGEVEGGGDNWELVG